MKISWIDVLVVVSFIIMLTLIIWKLYGDSPTELSVFVSIILFIGSLVFKIESRLDRRIDKLEENMKMSFNKVREDMSDLKQDIGDLKQK